MNLNKSFARRIGKSLSKLQQSLLENELPKYLFNPLSLYESKQYIAEVGIGMGDHFIERALQNPDLIHIGFEPYLNGIANCLKLALEKNVSNILLWPDDVNLVLNELPSGFLNELYILFPDPWHKLRHHKRRIFNSTRLKFFANILKAQGFLYVASDIKNYLDFTYNEIKNCGYFSNIEVNSEHYEYYIKTKYHLKAEEEGKVPRFLRTQRNQDIIRI